jgi:hypothetical protein
MNVLTSLKSLTLRRDKSQRNVALIETPLEIDILLGRSKGAFNHVGNRRFRVFILMHLQDYLNANSRMEKTLVVNRVYEQISDAGGRFLREDTKSDKWIQVPHKVGRDKVGHALRDAVGARVQRASSGNEEGRNGQKNSLPAKRISEVAIAKFRRNSVADRSRPPIVLEARFSRSCNDLNPDDHVAIKNTMALNAAQACLELQNQDSDDEEGGSSSELGQGGSSELMFEPFHFSSSKRSMEPTPLRSSTAASRPDGVRNRAKSSEATPDSDSPTVDKLLHDDRSGELSVMSESTTKKWYDLAPSSEFSVATVDTDVFDDVDGNEPSIVGFPRHLVDKVNARLSLEGSGSTLLSSRKKGESVVSRRKFDKGAKRPSKDAELSEEFSVMSLDTRGKLEQEDAGFKSEDFGLNTEEFVKATYGHGGLRSDDLCLKSDEFALPSHLPKSDDFGSACDVSIISHVSGLRASSSDFSARSSGSEPRNSVAFDIDATAIPNISTETSIAEAKVSNISDSATAGPDQRLDSKPRISWALDDQHRGLMDTVLEGSPLGDRNVTSSEDCDERKSGIGVDCDRGVSSGSGPIAGGGTPDPMRDSLSSEFGLKFSEWPRRSFDSLLSKEVENDDHIGDNDM